MEDSLIIENENENTTDGDTETGGETNQQKSSSANTDSNQPLPLQLSELGRLLFTTHVDIGAAMLETLVMAVGWPDTWSCSRSSTTLKVVLPVVVQEMRLLPEPGASGIIMCVARGFAVNGQHEEMRPGLTNLALVAYEAACLGGYQSHRATLKELAGWDDQKLNSFENDVFALSEATRFSKNGGQTFSNGSGATKSGNKPSTKKIIRELKTRLGAVLSPLVGRPASQLFARKDAAPIKTPAGARTVAPAPGAIAEEKARLRANQMLELDNLFT